MFTTIRPAIASFALLTLITGVGYPVAVTAIARIAFADKSTGSMIVRDGKTVGSELIAQPFSDPKYFWPRPSACNYDGAAGAGSNLGPTNPALAEAKATRLASLQAAHPEMSTKPPVEMLTASGSGLDPHISPAAAAYQVARVAKARGMSVESVQKRVDQNTETPTFGLLGESRVNVLMLNLALDLD